MATNLEVVHAYRQLWRNLLRAVQYTPSARRPALTQLRRGFRDADAVFDREGITRTNWFLEAAAKQRGMEHRILKNLLNVQRAREPMFPSWRAKISPQGEKLPNPLKQHKDAAFRHYDMTVAMLNKSMGLCLR